MEAHTGKDGSPFHFVGGTLALDLANTEVTARGQRRDLLATTKDLAAWLAAARHHYPALPPASDPDTGGDETLRSVHHVRKVIRDAFEAIATGKALTPATIAAINAILQRGEHVVEPDRQGSYRSVFRARSTGADEVLVPIAWSARELLTDVNPGRIHECANERCILLFHDTTKSGTRRWCSTGCMNRARSIARYREQKGRTQAG